MEDGGRPLRRHGASRWPHWMNWRPESWPRTGSWRPVSGRSCKGRPARPCMDLRVSVVGCSSGCTYLVKRVFLRRLSSSLGLILPLSSSILRCRCCRLFCRALSFDCWLLELRLPLARNTDTVFSIVLLACSVDLPTLPLPLPPGGPVAVPVPAVAVAVAVDAAAPPPPAPPPAAPLGSPLLAAVGVGERPLPAPAFPATKFPLHVHRKNLYIF